MERERQEAIARQEAMAEDLRKAELVRDRLENLDNIAKAYPEGHDMRVLIEGLHIDHALRAVEEDIRALREALVHPRGTSEVAGFPRMSIPRSRVPARSQVGRAQAPKR